MSGLPELRWDTAPHQCTLCRTTSGSYQTDAIQHAWHQPHHCASCNSPARRTSSYQPGNERQALQRARRATLTAFFELNQQDQHAHQYFYHEIPEHNVFKQKTRNWQRRVRRNSPIIGWIYQVQPSHPERFAIRLLLLHRKGVTSYQDLRTIDRQLHDTFMSVARAMGLFQDDQQHRNCLREASIMNMPSQMRQVFATLLVFQTPSDILTLFNDFKEVWRLHQTWQTAGFKCITAGQTHSPLSLGHR